MSSLPVYRESVWSNLIRKKLHALHCFYMAKLSPVVELLLWKPDIAAVLVTPVSNLQVTNCYRNHAYAPEETDVVFTNYRSTS